MKTLVILAAFSLVLSTGLTIPVRDFEDKYRQKFNAELREFDDDTGPGEAYRDEIDGEEHDYGEIYGEGDDNDYDEEFDEEEDEEGNAQYEDAEMFRKSADPREGMYDDDGESQGPKD